MPHPRRLGVFVGVLSAASTMLAVPADAEGVAEFYKDKTIAILMGTGPGGSYDLYGRTIAEHLGAAYSRPSDHHRRAHAGRGRRHRRQPHLQRGAAGRQQDPALARLAAGGEAAVERQESVSRPGKFQWLGAYDAIAQTMTLWHAAPAKTVDELKTKDLVIGSFNNTHLTYQWAMLLKTVLNANYKVITGYRGGNDLNLAMERGEIHGWTASWENLVGTRPQWLAEKKVNLLVQFTLERQAELPDVPTLIELAPPDKKDVAEFITSGTPFARAMAVGPRVPADRVAALRTAFDALMTDPAIPGRRQEAQARNPSAQRRQDPRAGGHDRFRLARPRCAGQDGDRPG